MPPPVAVEIDGVSHRYGNRTALEDVRFSVDVGEIFGLLGPNGGGKTTLFRIVSTMLPVQAGRVSVLEANVADDPDGVRRRIGVTFQSPSLDSRLTVLENLKHQSHLYGIAGSLMRRRIEELLRRLGLTDRTHDRVESLSGGLKRRVEIAKGLLHDPPVLLLDEPSTGLDPGARHELWRYLNVLRSDFAVSVLVTTHLMDEAEKCDRLGILDRGRIVAIGTPDELRNAIGGDCLTIHCANPDNLASRIADRFDIDATRVDDQLRIERSNGHELVRDLVAVFPDEIISISLGRPTLEDVFIARTGHRFWEDGRA